MVKRLFNNSYIGTIPKGCRMCMEGEKLVLFITGLCNRSCFYCPLSEERKGRDIIYANERRCEDLADVIKEAREMDAKGAGITGGDPGLKLERTLEYIRGLKEEFGSDFHIHLYTSQVLMEEELFQLRNAGLDEIRFHIMDENRNLIFDSMKTAKKTGMDVGVEIPAIPGQEKEIVKIAREVNSLGGFLNLNQLEFSHTNYENLEKEGFELESDETHGAGGSSETALKVLVELDAKDYSIHYCTSDYKDSVQLRKRLIRKALLTAKPHEQVTEDGLFFKGVIYVEGKNLKELEIIRKRFMRSYDIPGALIFLDREKNRLETTDEIAIFLSKEIKNQEMNFYLMEEYPTADRLETESTPLKD